jgi:plastocyanin
VTIKAGQAVVFTDGNLSPQTITEGTYGAAAANACVDAPLANNSSVIVTFWKKGSYQITSTQHAPEMQTSVLVK